jgi:hypothetical protein
MLSAILGRNDTSLDGLSSLPARWQLADIPGEIGRGETEGVMLALAAPPAAQRSAEYQRLAMNVSRCIYRVISRGAIGREKFPRPRMTKNHPKHERISVEL